MRWDWKQLIVGVFFGAFLSVLVMSLCFHPERGRDWNSEKHRARVLKKLSSKLDLSAEQKAQVSAILETKSSRMSALHNEVTPRFDAIRNEAREGIRKTLTPDQLPKYEKLTKKWDERRQKRRAQ